MTTRGLGLCFVAKFIHPVDPRDNVVNQRTFTALGEYAERLTVIGECQDRRTHRQVWGDGRAAVTLFSRPVSGWWSHLPFAARAVAEGLRVAREGPVDVWVASEPLGGAVACRLLRRLRGGGMLVEVQGELLDLRTISPARRRLMRAVTLASCRAADRVRCVSRQILEQLAAAGIPREKLVYLPTRCDTRRFDPARFREAGQARRRQCGIAPEAPVVIAVGALNVHKSYGDLLDALAAARRTVRAARRILVGDGPQRGELAARAARLGLTEAVAFTGRVPYDAVPEWLAAADVFASSSRNEGTPRAVLEAMALELPVVATAAGGVAEVVVEGATGLLTAPGDAAALGARLAELLADLPRARALGARGRARVAAHFEFADNIRDFHALLTSTARAGAGVPARSVA